MNGKPGRSDSLAADVRHPGFTPGSKDLRPLIALLASDDEGLVKASERALLRVAAAVIPLVVCALPESTRPQRARLVALAGKLAEATGDPLLLALLINNLHDSDLKAQLNAITGLGRLRGAEVEQALLALLAEAPRREVQAALVRALGKSGGAAAQAALADADAGGDAQQQRLLTQARLIVARELSREQESAIAGSVPWAGSLWLHCRRGLEELLRSEAQEKGFKKAEILGPGLLRAQLPGALTAVWELRLLLRAGIPLAPRRGDVAAAVAASLASPEARETLQRLTLGQIRYRLDWAEASKAQLWSLAEQLAEAFPDMVNDPTESTWEFTVLRRGGQTTVELVPKRLPDPRFTYRQGYVPAASHPTLAAALARVAGVRADDVVWDPFVGSGTELIERALLGPGSAFFGTDTDPEAITTARRNSESAGVAALLNLEVADSLTYSKIHPTLTITNPPMGRRVHRGQLHAVIEAFVAHLAAIMAPGGRLVWLSPLPELTLERFTALGLRVVYRQRVDMGGFDAELQRVEK